MNSNANDRSKSVTIAVVATCVLILSVGLSGCTASQAEPAPTASEKPTPVPATVAWKSKEVLVSDVEVIGDVAIAYRRQGPQLEIIARNLKNGKQLWKDEALGAADLRRSHPVINTVEYDGHSYVAYLGTKTGTYGQLKISDVATGKQLEVKENFDYWGQRPYVCGNTFCSEGAKARETEFTGYVHLKFDWSKKQWKPIPENKIEFGMREGGRRLDAGIITYWNSDDVEMLSYAEGAKTLWKRPYEQVFADGYSSATSWIWSAIGDNKGILIGYGSNGQDEFFESDKKKVVYPVEDLSKVVALDAHTGRTLWQLKGVAAPCGSMLSRDVRPTNETLVLCQYDSGKEILTATRKDHYRSKTIDLTWKAIGVDIVTGAKKWERRLSDPFEYADRIDGAGTPVDNASTSVLPLESGDKVVKNADGTVIALNKALGPNVLCTVERDSYYIYSATLGTEAPWDHKASGDTRFPDAQTVCKRGSWKPTKAVPDVDEFRRAGYKSEDVVVLSQLEGMVAYRLAAPAGN